MTKEDRKKRSGVGNNSDNKLINNEISQSITAAPYPIGNFFKNEITSPPAQKHGFYDPTANKVFGKG